MNRGVLAIMRGLMPNRPLSQLEAMRIAELQAMRLLEISGCDHAPVPDRVVTKVPKILVKRLTPWPVSGATDWAKGTWVIALNGNESRRRQRFTLAHEFKHILDYRYIDIAYPATSSMSHHERAEAVCDYFAGCLLVPRRWLKAAWGNGVQQPRALADTFDVSSAAIQTRLLQTGLTFQTERCLDSAQFRFHRRSELLIATT